MRQQARNFTMHSFDTYKFIKIIKNAGLTEEQAEAIVNTVSESREYDFSKLANKEQLDMHIQQLESKLDMNIQQLENKFELADQRFESIEKNMATKEDLRKLEVSLLKWMMPLLLTIIGMFGTVIFKLFIA